jgi:hypothetical protein
MKVLTLCLVDTVFVPPHLTTLSFNHLSPELNPICYLLALLAHDFLHVSRIRVKGKFPLLDEIFRY